MAGRTSATGLPPADGAPGTIEDTAAEVTRRGGRGIPAKVDCTNDQQVAALFARVEKEHGGVDVLATAVWGAADAHVSMEESMAAWGKPFWEQSTAMWQHMMNAGPYAYFLTSAHAIRLMVRNRRGLIVGVTDGYSETAPATPSDGMSNGQLVWSLSHQCINLLMKGIAGETKKNRIAVITLMPGFMRTERVVRALTTEKLKKQFGFDKQRRVQEPFNEVIVGQCWAHGHVCFR